MIASENLHDLIAEINAYGLRVLNLFQIDNSGMWQANVTNGTSFSEYGTDASDPARALRRAFDGYKSKRKPQKETTDSISDLI